MSPATSHVEGVHGLKAAECRRGSTPHLYLPGAWQMLHRLEPRHLHWRAGVCVGGGCVPLTPPRGRTEPRSPHAVSCVPDPSRAGLPQGPAHGLAGRTEPVLR